MNWLGLLGLILVLAKLFGFITISWWLVLLPFYGGLIVWCIFLLVVLILEGS